ncbi:MAG: glycosyltransferase family 2 protein, partial [Bdellovibrionales bacterium]|nr:glycosyltransferase family 2 protein [Bdellovibrionales bacterium]
MNLRTLSHLLLPKLRHAIDRAPRFGALNHRPDTSLQESLGEQYVTLVGWVFHPFQRCRLELRYNRKLLGYYIPNLTRTDVEQAFPLVPSSSHSGFEIKLPIAFLKACPKGKLTLTVLYGAQESCIWSWDGASSTEDPSPQLFDQYFPKFGWTVPIQQVSAHTPLHILIEGSGNISLIEKSIESAKEFLGNNTARVQTVYIAISDPLAKEKIDLSLSTLTAIWPEVTFSLVDQLSNLPSDESALLHIIEGALLPAHSRFTAALSALHKRDVDIVSFPTQTQATHSLFPTNQISHSVEPGFAHLCSTKLFHSLLSQFSKLSSPSKTSFLDILHTASHAKSLIFSSVADGCIALDASRATLLEDDSTPELWIILPPTFDEGDQNDLLHDLLAFHTQKNSSVLLLEETPSFPAKTVNGVSVFSLEEISQYTTQLRERYSSQKLTPCILSLSYTTTRAAHLLRYLIGGQVLSCSQDSSESISPEMQKWANWSDSALHCIVDKESLLSSTQEELLSLSNSFEHSLAEELGIHRKVSLIVPVYNSLAATLRCLQSVSKSTFAYDQVVVVDDASDSGTAKALRSFCEGHEYFSYIQRERNGGFIEACYTGLSHAHEDNDIILLNSD